MLRSMVSRAVCLGVKSHFDSKLNFSYCQTVAGLLIWDTLSDERTGLSFTISTGPCKAAILGPESQGTHDHILLSQFRDSPNLEGQVPVFMSPRGRVAQLYPQAMDSHFFASYVLQGTVEVFEPASPRA
jgi:hypothetical protein